MTIRVEVDTTFRPQWMDVKVTQPHHWDYSVVLTLEEWERYQTAVKEVLSVFTLIRERGDP